MKLLGCLLLLICTFTLGLAQTIPAPTEGAKLKTFKLTTPNESKYSYVIEKANEPKELIALESNTADIAAPDEPNGYSVYLVNLETNRAAKSDLVSILKAGTWAPKPEAFTLIAQIDIEIQTGAGIVPAGNLKIESKNKSDSTLITPTSDNKATFRFWPDASIKLTLDYEFDSEKKSKVESVEIPKGAVPHTVSIEIPEEFSVPVPDATTPSTQEKDGRDPPVAPDNSKNPLQSLFQLLVGLVVVGGLGYLAFWYYKNNQQVVEKLANQAGLNPQQSADPTGAMPPEPVKKELQKIDLGAGAEPTAVAPIAAAIPMVKNPRLVTASGDIFMIQPGSSTVGREGAALTIAGETSVSRLHASLERTGDSITLSDNGSTNGTYLNGIKIDSPRVLNPGDTVQFGSVQYRYEE